MHHWVGLAVVASCCVFVACKSSEPVPAPAPDAAPARATSAPAASAPAPAPTPSMVAQRPAPPAASGDAGADAAPKGVLEANQAGAMVRANPKLVGTMLTVRGRADTQEGSGGYSMLAFVDANDPLPAEYVGHTHLCTGKYAAEQKNVKRNEVFTARGKVGKSADKYLLLQDCDVVPSR